MSYLSALSWRAVSFRFTLLFQLLQNIIKSGVVCLRIRVVLVQPVSDCRKCCRFDPAGSSRAVDPRRDQSCLFQKPSDDERYRRLRHCERRADFVNCRLTSVVVQELPDA